MCSIRSSNATADRISLQKHLCIISSNVTNLCELGVCVWGGSMRGEWLR